MSNKKTIQSALGDLPDCRRDFRHAKSIFAAVADSSGQQITFDPLGEGAPCSELFNLYEFRLRNLSPEADPRQPDLESLLAEMPNDPNKKCHVAVIAIGDSDYTLFFSKDLLRVYGCVKHKSPAR